MTATFGRLGCYGEAENAGEVSHTLGDLPARSRRSSKLHLQKKLLKKPSLSMDESETIPVLKQVRRESIVFRELDRSTNSHKKVSQRADSTIDRIDKVLDSNKDSQRQFFNARRRIAEAACKVAKDHKIGLQMLDDDSDDERSNFFSGVSTSQSSTVQPEADAGAGGAGTGPDGTDQPQGQPIFRAPKRFYKNKNLAKFLERLP